MDYMNEASDLQNSSSWTQVTNRKHIKPPSNINQLQSHPPSVLNQLYSHPPSNINQLQLHPPSLLNPLKKHNQNSQGFRQNSPWRSKLKTVHGNAKSITYDNSIHSINPADINLVILGLSKDTSSESLISYVNNHNIKLLKCEVLTKSENAHLLSYKGSIRCSDYDTH